MNAVPRILPKFFQQPAPWVKPAPIVIGVGRHNGGDAITTKNWSRSATGSAPGTL